MVILAKIFPLNENSAGDNYGKFNSFWSQVEGCEVEKINMRTYNPPKTVEDFKNQLIDLRTKFEEVKYKYLVLAVSSHGIEQEQDIYGKESNEKKGVEVAFEIEWGSNWKPNRYKVNELLEIFKDVAKKQKIFIMQMCRNRSDEGTVTSHGKDFAVMHRSNTEPSFGTHVSEISIQQTQGELTAESYAKAQSTETLERVPWPKTWKLAQPCIRDSIVMFSSPSGYVSFDNNYTPIDGGGWIFLSMEKLLKSLQGQTISVIDLFLKVNQEMSKTFTISIKDGKDTCIGLSSFNHMLTQDIMFKFKD
ncbi:uncharacterized protein LOC127733848 [Mytilus californianus]|uniref:uncharacterized protein LOC127733848 n=1 Tax=Mytilus californianus TaxID=6549 RepID=UPI002246D186|nr:uncharacterized protein LOC127733848 [Mytilus californianus]XP_052099222.1 uncharacterized protein LOC127733848 [Mytilus californianus]